MGQREERDGRLIVGWIGAAVSWCRSRQLSWVIEDQNVEIGAPLTLQCCGGAVVR